jgi:hypothetical protein
LSFRLTRRYLTARHTTHAARLFLATTLWRTDASQEHNSPGGGTMFVILTLVLFGFCGGIAFCVLGTRVRKRAGHAEFLVARA